MADFKPYKVNSLPTSNIDVDGIYYVKTGNTFKAYIRNQADTDWVEQEVGETTVQQLSIKDDGIDEWEQNTYNRNDRVRHNGKYWAVLVGTTTEEPSDIATDWVEYYLTPPYADGAQPIRLEDCYFGFEINNTTGDLSANDGIITTNLIPLGASDKYLFPQSDRPIGTIRYFDENGDFLNANSSVIYKSQGIVRPSEDVHFFRMPVTVQNFKDKIQPFWKASEPTPSEWIFESDNDAKKLVAEGSAIAVDSVNLYDYKTMTDERNGVSLPIPVKPRMQYYKNTGLPVKEYNSSDVEIASHSTPQVFTTNSNASYIKIHFSSIFPLNNAKNAYIVEGYRFGTPEVIKNPIKHIPEFKPIIEKSWCHQGDSISASDYCYPNLVQKDLNFRGANLNGMSGRTMGNFVFHPNYFKGGNYDIMTYALGTNDQGYSIEIGSFEGIDNVLDFPTENDFPATGESGKLYVAMDNFKVMTWTGSIYEQVSTTYTPTFYVTIHCLVLKSYSLNPKASIGFITPIKRSDNGITENVNAVSFTTKEYRDAIIDYCQKKGIKYLDAYYIFEPKDKHDRANFISDGTHPTVDGHKIKFYPVVREWLKTLF